MLAVSEVYRNPEGREFRFNDLVVFEGLIATDEKRVGRIVQVRIGVGAFGSDMFLARLHNGALMSFHNVMIRHAGDKRFEFAYYESNGRTPPTVHPSEEYPKDEPGETYCLKGDHEETGFLIDQPSQPDDPTQSFAMRIVTQ